MSGAFQILISISICDDVGICLVTKSLNSIKKKHPQLQNFAFLFILSYIWQKPRDFFKYFSCVSAYQFVFFSYYQYFYWTTEDEVTVFLE